MVIQTWISLSVILLYLVTCSVTMHPILHTIQTCLLVLTCMLLCDIVVSCDLLSDPPVTRTFLTYMLILTWLLTSCVTLLNLVAYSWPPIPHTIQTYLLTLTCMLTSCVTLVYLVTCSMTTYFSYNSDLFVDSLFLIQFRLVCWFWPGCWPPVLHCCIVWPAPWPFYSSYKFDLYNSDLFVDSDLNIDLLCDIVV
jgi:hypothetical protein